jgi:hypothetical protein
MACVCVYIGYMDTYLYEEESMCSDQERRNLYTHLMYLRMQIYVRGVPTRERERESGTETEGETKKNVA